MFDNRIEIISPGHLPNNLTVEKIRSGIKRALEDWPEIKFTDDRDGCLFTATVHRKVAISSEESEAGSEKSSERILALLKGAPELPAREIADALRISQRAVEKQIARLREEARIRRTGPAKGGHWEVVE
ncbi:MAG: HTH domain-containing protein [Syntrophobacteraceae bacterium]